jgi:hypothetical protein
VASSLDLDHVMQTVVQLLHDTFGYQRCSVYQLFGEALQLKSQVGYEESHVIRQIPISRGVSGRAVRTREAQFVVRARRGRRPGFP